MTAKGLHSPPYEAILASLADNLYVFDRQLRYAYVSPNAAAALQRTPAEIIGRSWRELNLPATLMESVEAHIRAIFTSGASVRAEAELAQPDGLHHYEYVLTPVRPADGSAIDYVTAIGRDITERKRLEMQQKAAEDRLLNARGFEQKIVAIVGHDIRNPLGAIELAAGRILRNDGASDAALATKSAQLITRSVERIQHIVDELLDFTRARQGGIPIKLERTSLDIICKEILEELHGVAAGRPVTFECDGDMMGHWDPHRIAQAVSNLVANAFQHSAPGSPVQVTARRDGDRIRLDVHNDGEIAADVLPTIFDPFRRGLGQHKSEGLGLGLYIAHTIVDAHEGQLEVQSSRDGGTTFTVTLPRKPSAAAVAR